MKKIVIIFWGLLTVFSFTSCKKEANYTDLKYYRVEFRDNRTLGYFGIFNGNELIYKIRDYYNHKRNGNKCFVISRKWIFHKWHYVGLFFVDGKLKSKIKGITDRYFLTSDFKNLIYYEYDRDKNDEIYKNLIIRDIETGKVLNDWKFSEIIKNKDIVKLYEWNFTEQNNSVEITLKDSWGEIFEKFEINLADNELTRIPVNYSKTDPDALKDLPSVH